MVKEIKRNKVDSYACAPLPPISFQSELAEESEEDDELAEESEEDDELAEESEEDDEDEIEMMRLLDEQQVKEQMESK